MARAPKVETVSIEVAREGRKRRRVSARIHAPASPSGTGVLLGHGAGADMDTPLVKGMAEELSLRGHVAMRFNFLYMEEGRKLPDGAAMLEKTLILAMETLRPRVQRLVIGGKSMGGRYASIVASKGAKCDGLVFLGYPLHPPGKPEKLRDAHLGAIAAPMLFISGTRDPLCDMTLLRPVISRLGSRATLHAIEDADHSLDLPKASKRPREVVYPEIADVIDGWIRTALGSI